MKKAILLHNPGAGEEDHFRTELIQAIENDGYQCEYYLIKTDSTWLHRLESVDIIIIAGGDGTIRRMVKDMMDSGSITKTPPITILPMGTANNLSKTLNIDRNLDYTQHIQTWRTGKTQPFDLGVIELDTTKSDFFLEGAGYGVFPTLMKIMESEDRADSTTVEERLELALKKLHQIVLEAKADNYYLEFDQQVKEGKCLLLEVMNIQSIGPNILLSEDVLLDDGLLNIVLIEENQREEFAAYIKSKLFSKSMQMDWKQFKSDKIVLHSDSPYMHIDDELIQSAQKPITFTVLKNSLQFIVP